MSIAGHGSGAADRRLSDGGDASARCKEGKTRLPERLDRKRLNQATDSWDAWAKWRATRGHGGRQAHAGCRIGLKTPVTAASKSDGQILRNWARFGRVVGTDTGVGKPAASAVVLRTSRWCRPNPLWSGALLGPCVWQTCRTALFVAVGASRESGAPVGERAVDSVERFLGCMLSLWEWCVSAGWAACGG